LENRGSVCAEPIGNAPALLVPLSAEALRPLLAELVAEAVARLAAHQASLGTERLAWSEPKAAALLGLRPHQLRGERRRGRIAASEIVGGRVRYLREDLVSYLMQRRTGPAGWAGNAAGPPVVSRRPWSLRRHGSKRQHA
jgi:hypothetical protein